MRKYVNESQGTRTVFIPWLAIYIRTFKPALAWSIIVQKVLMQRINGDLDLDSLRIELRKKDNDLLLAARFGESLLEENDQLKNQLKILRDEHSNLQEVSWTSW